MILFKKTYKLSSGEIMLTAVTAVVLLVMFGILLGYNIKTVKNQQFVYLADSFLSGRLDFQENHKNFLTQEIDGKYIWTDTSDFRGKKFWPLGPFPAVLLLPFVAIFGTGFLQGFLAFALSLLNFYLLWKLAKKFDFRSRDALWLASFFIFGTIYLGAATFSVSWYFAQVVATTLLLLALLEYFTQKRFWLVGIMLALAILTRSNLILVGSFFGLIIFFSKENRGVKLKNFAQIIFPIFTSLFLILLYNWARFGNFFESGYNLQNIALPHESARAMGLFSLKHIPGNLFFLIFRGPNPVLAGPNSYVLQYPYITADIWGMGIFFSSPILLYIFSAPWRDKIVRSATLASILILISIITYYGIGAVQIGYRYALDLLPFLYIILCKALTPKLPLKAKTLIVLGIILNWHIVFHFRS